MLSVVPIRPNKLAVSFPLSPRYRSLRAALTREERRGEKEGGERERPVSRLIAAECVTLRATGISDSPRDSRNK